MLSAVGVIKSSSLKLSPSDDGEEREGEDTMEAMGDNRGVPWIVSWPRLRWCRNCAMVYAC